ncbi:MAG: hypothetical protein P4K83_10000 [Terracidiphilus sp.]|nr:hypothetical protein [Terracidiphilus sp.]
MIANHIEPIVMFNLQEKQRKLGVGKEGRMLELKTLTESSVRFCGRSAMFPYHTPKVEQIVSLNINDDALLKKTISADVAEKTKIFPSSRPGRS